MHFTPPLPWPIFYHTYLSTFNLLFAQKLHKSTILKKIRIKNQKSQIPCNVQKRPHIAVSKLSKGPPAPPTLRMRQQRIQPPKLLHAPASSPPLPICTICACARKIKPGACQPSTRPIRKTVPKPTTPSKCSS